MKLESIKIKYSTKIKSTTIKNAILEYYVRAIPASTALTQSTIVAVSHSQ